MMMFHESPEERLSRQLIGKMYTYDDPKRTKHVTRLASAVGPLIWKISQLTGECPRPWRENQAVFLYGDCVFRARYQHLPSGRLEIVPMHGAPVVTITSLGEAMELDLAGTLAGYLHG